jgi:TolB-like protein
VVLFIIGLPIVLATAFVQEGLGDRDTGEVETTAGGTPIPSTSASGPDSLESDARRLFTWRNALLGGLVAFALWGVVAAAWLVISSRDEPHRSANADVGTDAPRLVKSIAVLAFEDMSPEGDQEYFSDGISEEILDALAKVDGLRVAGRSSAFQFKGTNPDLRDVGRQLGVEAVLEGSVRKSGDQLRITAQLVNADDGFHLWSETYDRRLADVFVVQQEIAQAIVAALGFGEVAKPSVGTAGEERIAAHDFYLLGLYRWNRRRSAEDIEAALSHFQRAAHEDSLFARAHAQMALIYAVWPQWDSLYSEDDAIRLGKAEAARAAELDPALAQPYAALCQMATWYEWEWAAADEYCRKAIELRPNYATAHHWYSELLLRLGRAEEGLAEAKLAKQLDPLSPAASNAIAWSNVQLGDYEAALAANEETRELAPDAWFVAWATIVAGSNLRRPDGLEDAYLAWAATPEDSTLHRAFVAAFLEAPSNETRRLEAIAMVPDLRLRPGVEPTLYMLLDAPERALSRLEELSILRDSQLPHVLQMPVMAPLQSDPRFQELKRKAGLDRPPAAVG